MQITIVLVQEADLLLDDAYQSFLADSKLPEYYQTFHAKAYSFENSFPWLSLQSETNGHVDLTPDFVAQLLDFA